MIILNENVLSEVSRYLKNNGYRLVFVNGCFDILHRGHIKLLKFAKSHGDLLIVALNSDNSIKKLKGSIRPILKLKDRLTILDSITYVDIVTSFDEEEPSEILEVVRPDIVVKGPDYKNKKIKELKTIKEIGAKIIILKGKKLNSSSDIIKKVIS